jgi:hypothetical protein
MPDTNDVFVKMPVTFLRGTTVESRSADILSAGGAKPA